MSGISDTATVTLNVNGFQAKQMMADLEKNIKSTEAAIRQMKEAQADPKDIEKAKKQLAHRKCLSRRHGFSGLRCGVIRFRDGAETPYLFEGASKPRPYRA